MWCCISRDQKKSKFLSWDPEQKAWIYATAAVEGPGENEYVVEVDYVNLNQWDKNAIIAKKDIGHTFSGVVKAVGKGIPAEVVIPVGTKVYGYGKPDSSTLAEFIVVPANLIAKVPSGVSQKVAAALPHIVYAAENLESLVAKDKTVFYSGLKNGYYESIFNALVAKNGAKSQPDLSKPVNFFLHTDGGYPAEDLKKITKESYDSQLTLVQEFAAILEGSKAYKTTKYESGQLANVTKYTAVTDNVSQVLSKVYFAPSETASTKEKFLEGLTKIGEKNGHGPIVVDISVLASLPTKKETPPPDQKSTSGGTTTPAPK